jgi:uncharacterized membrane protein
MKITISLISTIIISILLLASLYYGFFIKPKEITYTSYIPTAEIITETSFIPTPYIITTTYPTTITKTITETLTYTYVPTEKIEVISSTFMDSGKAHLILDFIIQNKEYSSIYIDPNRMIRVEGRGLLINHPAPETAHWYLENNRQRGPFTLVGSTYNPPTAEFHGLFWGDEGYFNPKEIKHGQVYTVSFDYKVIYINGTWSDWKTFTFNVTYKGRDLG